MGRDIHMHIVDKHGKYLMKDIYEGRNSEWFNNLQGKGCDDCYNHLYTYYGFPENILSPEGKTFDDLKKEGYYGFYYVSVGSFRKWYETYKPQIKAGWFCTYDKWKIEKKGYVPEDPQHYLIKEDCTEDMHFIEYIDTYEPSSYIYKILEERFIDNDAYIIYYFDC